MEKVAIVHSIYIAWKGHVDVNAMLDKFILCDGVEYARRDLRNRIQIKTPQRIQRLTIPIKVRGKYHQVMHETEIKGSQWALGDRKVVHQNRHRPPRFYGPRFNHDELEC
jgi:hypothetical protein